MIQTEIGTKVCSSRKCRRILPLDDFHKNRSRKDGLDSQCRKCKSQRAKKYRVGEEGREVLREYHKKYCQTERGQAVQHEAMRKHFNTLKGRLGTIFNHMNQRCNFPNDISYRNYGGRGIQNKFKTLDGFRDYVINDLGIKTIGEIRGLQIDRIDNDGNYEPGNIRFITAKENCNNTRRQR